MSVMIETRPAGDIHVGCGRHPFENALAVCDRCQSAHCSDCLVFPFGSRRAPLCIPCALVAGGIRRH